MTHVGRVDPPGVAPGPGAAPAADEERRLEALGRSLGARLEAGLPVAAEDLDRLVDMLEARAPMPPLARPERGRLPSPLRLAGTSLRELVHEALKPPGGRRGAK